MADNKIVLKVVADYDRAIKEWEQLRDGVASTNQEYKEALIEIDKLKRAKAELTGETHKTSEALLKETKASRESTEEYQERKKQIQDAFKNQEKFNNSIGSSSVLSFNNSINATKRERNALIELRNTLDITGDEFVVVSNKISLLDQKLKSSANSNKNFTKSQLQAKDATGATTSSVLELGRIISDAPYGIRGMANNITQLVSQLGFATKSAGSLRLALKGMWTAMMGPLGIVLAITSVVSLLDSFYGANKKAEDSQKDLNDELERSAGLLKEIESIREVLNISGDAISLDWIDSFVAGIDEINTKDLLKILERDIKGITNAFDRLPKEEQNIQGIASIVDKRKKLLESLDTEKKLKEELTTLQEEFSKSGTRSLRDNKVASKFRSDIIDKQKELLSLQKSIIDIETLFTKMEEKVIDRPLAKALDKIKPIGVEDVYDIRLIEGIVIPPPKFEYEETIFEKINAFIERYKSIIGGITNFTNGEFERQKTIEQNKTNVLNEQLNNRLLNENLSKDQRQSIQNQIAINDEALRKKQEDIAKKQFMVNKAFNISSALVDTYSAAMSAYKNTLASPTNILLGPAIALARAKKAAAIASVGGLLQVAAIARQKFQSSAAATPVNIGGGGADSGGGQGDRSFDFNLVGATQGNQVLDAIQGQFNKPVQAYVVSRDMTSQQQLDANIKNQASF